MKLVKWEPFREMVNLQERVNRLFLERAFGRFPSLFDDSIFTRSWAPAVDVYENENEVVLKAELPGMKREDVHLEVRDHSLILSGERKQEKETKEEDFHRVERSYGSFYRAFNLPSTVDASKVKANMKDGVLEVVLPKVEEARPKLIPIESR